MSRLHTVRWAASIARLAVTDALDVAWTRCTREGRRVRRDTRSIVSDLPTYVTFRRNGAGEVVRTPPVPGVALTGWKLWTIPEPPPEPASGSAPSWLDDAAKHVREFAAQQSDPLAPLPFNVRDVRREIEDARLARTYAEASELDPWPDAPVAEDERLERLHVPGAPISVPNLPTFEDARSALAAAYRAVAEEESGITGPALRYAAWTRLTHAERWALDRARYLDEENNR
jgi:hypothetical protein